MLSNCAQCKFFDHHPHHSEDIRCGVAPAYTSMWIKLKSLDESTLNAIPVDSCRDFELDPCLVKQEINLALTFSQWQKLICDYDCPKTILNALQDKFFEHSLSLTLGDWQAIANSSNDQSVLDSLAHHDIEPESSAWIDVDSSCIKAIAFDESTSILMIHFHSNSVYEYYNFDRFKFSDFRNASSHGRFFHRNIKDIYDFSLSH